MTVRDDEGVLVGETSINVIKVAGDGLAEGDATESGAMTKNGSATFSYAAGLEGQVVFRVIAGKGAGAIRDIITLTVGTAMPEEPDMPAMPEGDATLRVQGSLGLFSGGSVADLAAAAEAACPGGANIYVEGSDGWGSPYVTDATIDIVNMTFAARFADGIAAGTLVGVPRCEADAMDSEGAMGG